MKTNIKEVKLIKCDQKQYEYDLEFCRNECDECGYPVDGLCVDDERELYWYNCPNCGFEGDYEETESGYTFRKRS